MAGDSAGIGVGVAIGLGVEIGVGLGVGVAMRFGVGVGVGLGLGVAEGLGVGLASGLGVGIATCAVGLGSGEAIGSSVGVGIGSKIGVAIGCSVKVSIGSGVGDGLGLGVAVGTADSSAGAGLLWRKGVEAASCAGKSGAAARKTVAIASRQIVFFRLSPSGKLVRSEASARSSTRSSRIDSRPAEIGERRGNEKKCARLSALGYKIGQLRIRELRSYAEKELGQKFDLRAFHDEVLRNGALPMNVLEKHTKEWVAKAKNA